MTARTSWSVAGTGAIRARRRDVTAVRRPASARRWVEGRRGRLARLSTTRAASSDDRSDGSTLVETSSGGQQQRRWGRTANGGFNRLPPKRPEEEELAGNGDESSGFTTWDPRQSPRLRSVFLPAGYPDTVSDDYAPFIRWHLGSLMFRNILEVITAQSLLVALGMGSTPGALPPHRGDEVGPQGRHRVPRHPRGGLAGWTEVRRGP